MKTKNKIFLFIIVTLFIGLSSCKKESNQRGFYLQRFEVINPQLNAIIHGIQDSSAIKNVLRPEKNVVVMVLRIYNSVPEFGFTSAEMDDFSEMYIFQKNRRIVGYIDIENSPVIVLSTITSLYEFMDIFYKFLVPTENTKQFEYIYFPDNMYCFLDEFGIPCPPSLFDPYFYSYAFKDGKFVFMNYEDEL
ncbi:MAG: hypothetical protein LBN93_11675 [Candidatus Symbiothrix sp.]|jgi:hypothetical protein|nr:hypothetical protein [Candidatus Symbiothrix sp.]